MNYLKNKKLLYISHILLLLLLPTSHLSAAQLTGGNSLTTTGSSGMINVASADTIENGLAVSLLTTTDFRFSELALMPRFGMGFLKMLEISGGVDMPFKDMSYTSGLLGLKWKFWQNEKVALAISGNLQFNSHHDGLNIDSQILIHSTWKYNENFTTSAVFGKTFGQSGNDWRMWDFGIGLEWWLINQEVFQLAVVVDYANYEQRAYVPYIPNAGAFYRGNVSSAARFGFLNKVIMFDIGATNILDHEIALYTSIATSFNF